MVDEQSHAPECAKKKWKVFRRFRVKEPRPPKTYLSENLIVDPYRSTRRKLYPMNEAPYVSY